MKINKILCLFIAICCYFIVMAEEHEEKYKPYTAYMVCNAHLDSQWNWDVRTTINEYLPRTLFQNIYLMQRYPLYRFSFEGGIKYAWMKEYYPCGFEILKQYVDSGQWHIAGASWDATDTNIPSPESFFRNILLGQEFYKKEFGLKSTDIFLPDCFGFSYTLPTIAAHCGLIGMSTQKLNWRSNAYYEHPYHNKNPFSWGIWKGIDGSSIMAAFDTGGYNAELPENVQYNKRLITRAKQGFENTCFRYYSGGDKSGNLRVGDRGNSGTVSTCRRLYKAMSDSNAPIKIISATSDQLFNDYVDRKNELPVYDGELLMDVHGTGCYTSLSSMKYYNRRNEELISAAEKASVVADWLGNLPYDGNKINEIWKRFLWHQFHDDLTGTSIPEAYRYSWNDELISLQQSSDVLCTAVAALSYRLDTRSQGYPVVVYNAVAADVNSIVEVNLPNDNTANEFIAVGEDGSKAPVQIIEKNDKYVKVVFVANVPSIGFAVYDIRKASSRQKSKLRISQDYIENSIYSIRTDSNGDLVSIIDKRCGKELIENGKSFRLAVIKNNLSTKWPAWEIMKSVLDSNAFTINGNVKTTVVETGPVRATLKIERSYGKSSFIQYISLTDGTDHDNRIDFRTEIDWHENNSLLKAEFPLSVSNMFASYDLGLGYIRRGNNTLSSYEVPAYKWADITNKDGSYGITVLNNCKYGWDKPNNNTLRLTLIHTPGVDKRYTYQSDLDKGLNRFIYSVVGHQNELNADAYFAGEELNMPLIAFTAPKHHGNLGKKFSMISASDKKIGIRTFKKAENGNGYIVRIYNLSDDSIDGELLFPAEIVAAEECNGIEEKIAEADFVGKCLKFNIGRFAPKTFRIHLAENNNCPMPELFEEKLINLPFNATVFTTDEFRTYYMFDDERETYAAEILPDTISCKGVKFILGEENINDAVLCNGQSINIPPNFKKLYILAAAANESCNAEFYLGDIKQSVNIPLWKGFYGQCGWEGYSKAFMKEDVLAYVGTHRHNGETGNIPYGFSYIYRIELDIPDGTSELILPDNKNIAIFAISASNGMIDKVQLASELFDRPL